MNLGRVNETQITARDTYITAKALTYAIKTIEDLPGMQQEVSDCADMRKLLAHLVPDMNEREALFEHVFEKVEGVRFLDV